MTRKTFGRACLSAVTAFVAPHCAAPAHGQLVPPGDAEQAPGPQPVLEVPVARFDWSVPERYARGWQAWNQSDASYDPEYVNPDRWGLNVDACGSSGGGEPIVGYDVEVTGVGLEFRTRST